MQDEYGLWIPLMSSRKDETVVWYYTYENKCVRFQHQFFLVVQTNCKHFYSFLGPYINSCKAI